LGMYMEEFFELVLQGREFVIVWMIYDQVVEHGDIKHWVILHHGGEDGFYVGCYGHLCTMFGWFLVHDSYSHFKLKKGFRQFLLFCSRFLSGFLVGNKFERTTLACRIHHGWMVERVVFDVEGT